MKNTAFRNSDRSERELRHVDTQPSSEDIEVLADDWERFLDAFSNQHQGWLVNVFTSPAGKKYEKFPQIIGRPLTHVCVQRKRPHPEVEISVVGNDIEPYLVPDPMRLVFKQDSEGAHEGLDVTSADGSVTSVRFRVSARPETLDGILPTGRITEAKCADWKTPVPEI
jgi:hypothetical protein